MFSISFDLGTHFGWSIFYKGDYFKSGHYQIPIKKEIGEKMAIWEREAQNIISLCPCQNKQKIVICFEEVLRHLGFAAAHMYGGYSNILYLIAYKNKIPVFPLPVKTIKKSFTGNGNATKIEVLEKVKEIYNFKNKDITDYNEADAIAINFSFLRKK